MRANSGLLSALCVAGIAFAGPAHADDKVETLAPSSPWSLDYAEEKCRLARVFGDEANRTVLFFEQGAPGPSFSMSVGGASIDAMRAVREVDISFGPLLHEDVRHFIGEFEGLGRAIILTGIALDPELDVDEEQEALPVAPKAIDTQVAGGLTQIAVSRGSRTVVLETGALDKPFAALNQCAFDLIRHWGLDADQHRTMTRDAKWTNQKVVSRRIAQLYPASALQAGEMGFVRMRVIIETDGAVSECKIESATATDHLESPACREMRGASFEPALDLEGQPMRSYHTTTIVYIMG